jgi:hypothetical protein
MVNLVELEAARLKGLRAEGNIPAILTDVKL